MQIKYIKFKKLGVIAAVLLIFFEVAAEARATDKVVTIGTAGTTGVYYPTGGALCRLLQRGRKEHGINCTVEPTSGSIYNLNAIKDGSLSLGIAQSDWVYHSYNGVGVFSGAGKNSKLRTVFTLHNEPFTILVKGKSNVDSFKDLQGKRFSIGGEGSGNRATIGKLLSQMNLGNRFFGQSLTIRNSEQGKALCEGRVDGILFMVGHPNGMVQEVTSSCAARIINIEERYIAGMIENHPYYSRVVIPGGMYTGNPDDITTFAVKAMLVASEDVDDEVIYHLVKSVFDNLENFKTLHPVFSTLDPAKMATDGVIAPLHNGAAKYYRERGWIQ